MTKRLLSKRHANGEAIRALRLALGIKHSDFARDTGMSTGYLANIEAGRRPNPAPDVLRRIADRLGVGIDAISYPVHAEPAAPAQVPA